MDQWVCGLTWSYELNFDLKFSVYTIQYSLIYAVNILNLFKYIIKGRKLCWKISCFFTIMLLTYSCTYIFFVPSELKALVSTEVITCTSWGSGEIRSRSTRSNSLYANIFTGKLRWSEEQGKKKCHRKKCQFFSLGFGEKSKRKEIIFSFKILNILIHLLLKKHLTNHI